MKLLTKKQLKEKVGYSFSHIDRLERLDGPNRFPQRVKPFGRNGRAFWLEEEVDHWITQRVIERNSV
jgi:predicted DNA-binding transcriptional regulator AlpA